MDPHKSALELHDRSTRGELLTSQEIQQLEAWYDQQDAIEQAQLAPPAPVTTNLVELQSQIESVLHQLTGVTQHIQHTIADNHTLREENNQLRNQLTLPRSA